MQSSVAPVVTRGRARARAIQDPSLSTPADLTFLPPSRAFSAPRVRPSRPRSSSPRPGVRRLTSAFPPLPFVSRSNSLSPADNDEFTDPLAMSPLTSIGLAPVEQLGGSLSFTGACQSTSALDSSESQPSVLPVPGNGVLPVASLPQDGPHHDPSSHIPSSPTGSLEHAQQQLLVALLHQQQQLITQFTSSQTQTISSLTTTVNNSARGESRGLAMEMMSHSQGMASVNPAYILPILTLGSTTVSPLLDRVSISSLSQHIHLPRFYAHLRTTSFREDDPIAPTLSDDQLLGFFCFRFHTTSEKYAVQLIDLRADNKTKSTAPSDFKGFARCMVYACHLYSAMYGPWIRRVFHELFVSFATLAVDENSYPLPLLIRVIEKKLSSLPAETLSLAPSAVPTRMHEILCLSFTDSLLHAEVFRHFHSLLPAPKSGGAAAPRVKAPPLKGTVPCFKWITGKCTGTTCTQSVIRPHLFDPANSSSHVTAYRKWVTEHIRT